MAALLFAMVLIGCRVGMEDDTFTVEGYPFKLGTFKGLSGETEWRILQDFYEQFDKPYMEKNPESIANYRRIVGYGGTYRDYIVVVLDPDPYARAQVARGRMTWTFKGKEYNSTYLDETITWKQGQIYFYDEYNELFTQGERNAILKHLNPGCPDIGGLK